MQKPYGTYRRNKQSLKPSRLSHERSENKPKQEECKVIRSQRSLLEQGFIPPDGRQSPVPAQSAVTENETYSHEY